MSHLLEKLKSSKVQERREVVSMLINRTVFDWVADRDEREIDFAIPDLAKALSDSDEEVRKLSIQAIRIQQQEFSCKSVFEAVPAIIEVLLDKEREHIRAKASLIFRDVVIEGYNISKVLPSIIDLLSDSNESVKFGVADALTINFASKGQWEEVSKLLNHEDKDVRQEAAGTLGHYQTTTKVDITPLIPDLVSLLSNENEEVRFVAARSLAKVANEPDVLKPALEILVEFLSGDEKRIRNNAISSLGDSLRYKINCRSNLAKKNWEIYNPVIQAFEKLYKRKDKTLKNAVARKLMGFYLHTNNYGKIEHLLKSGIPAIRKELIYELYGCLSFCEVDFTPIIPTLLQMYLSDKDEDVRDAAENRLNDFADRKIAYAELMVKELHRLKIDANKAWKFFEHLNKSVNRKKRVELDNGLDGLDDEAKLVYLKNFLQDENPVSRAWAAYQLFNLGGYSTLNINGAISDLATALQDENVFVRYYASNALFFIKTAGISKAVAPLITLLADPLFEIRTHAIVALKNAFDVKVSVAEAFPIVQELLLTDPIDQVRAQASFFLYDAAVKGIDIAFATEALITALSDSDEVVRDMCARTLARYLMNPSLSQRLPREIKQKKIKKGSGIRELLNRCKKESH